SLLCGGYLNFGTAAGTISVHALAFQSNNTANLAGANSVDVVAGRVAGPGDGAAVSSGRALAVGTVDGVDGITTNFGYVRLTVWSGDALTVSRPIDTAGNDPTVKAAGMIFLTADSLSIGADVRGKAGT